MFIRYLISPNIYFKDEDHILNHTSFIINLECLTQDSIVVNIFQMHLLFFFSDGFTTKYKNKRNSINLCADEADFGCLLNGTYATCCGKDPCGSVSGTATSTWRVDRNFEHLAVPKRRVHTQHLCVLSSKGQQI